MTFTLFGNTYVSTSKKPSRKKNFFENYLDHLFYLEQTILKDMIKIMEKKDLRCFTQKVCKHVTLFDPLRDGHDYFDEVMGATLLPVALSLTSIGLLTASLCEGIMALFIQTNVIENDDKTHGQRAGIYLFSALLVSILSYATFLKSAASLITRPLVTVFQGCKEQDIPRFYY